MRESATRFMPVCPLFRTCSGTLLPTTSARVTCSLVSLHLWTTSQLCRLLLAWTKVLEALRLLLAPRQLSPPVEEKKERKKRQHDPNAPKRPLTPYFLYMQTARPIIATDLGNEAPKGAVQDEGQRRWASMNPDEKMAWNNAYQFNLRLYHARVHSYKAGNPAAREMSDQDALAYADANAIPQPNVAGSVEEPVVGNDQDAIVEQLQMTAPVVAPAAAAISEEVAKTPKPKGSTRKRKSTAADSEDVEASAVKTAAATPASPDKKRKRASKVAEPATEEPKKSARKKKNA
ncbi:hypothetical protein PG995_003440 [Apiospora arundinis]